MKATTILVEREGRWAEGNVEVRDGWKDGWVEGGSDKVEGLNWVDKRGRGNVQVVSDTIIASLTVCLPFFKAGIN